MINDLSHWKQQLLRGELTRDELLWALLLVGLILATAHLVTLIVTRWGDTRVSSKSLVASIILHITCALGLVVVEPAPELTPVVPPADEQPELERVLVEPQDVLEDVQPGDSPFWDRVLQPDVTVARLDHPQPEPFVPESPDRNQPVRRQYELDFPELPTLPDEPEAVPDVAEGGETGERVTASTDFRMDEPHFEQRDDVRIPSNTNRRLPVPSRGQLDVPIERAPTIGSIDREAPELDLDSRLQTPEAPVDPEPFLEEGPEGELAERRGPAPHVSPEEAPGTVGTEPGAASRAGSPSPPRYTRIPARRPDAQGTEPVTVRRDTTPRSPSPRREIPLSVQPAPEGLATIEGLQPNVVDRDFDAPLRGQRQQVAPSYQLRELSTRSETAQRYGGTRESEEAVNNGLKWLVAAQSSEGYWDADRFGSGRVRFDENSIDRRYAGRESDTGVTGLALLAFLGAGHTQSTGDYQPTVTRAIGWLISQQDSDGNLSGNATHFARMYCHAMATYALAEAYGMLPESERRKNATLRRSVERAVSFIVDNQNPTDGGWRYRKGQPGDMSMFGWQLMALRSAQTGGLNVPATVTRGMIGFLQERSLGESGGLAAYREGEPVSAAMTAEALFCKEMLGIERDSAACREAVAYLQKHLPSRREFDLYYWYYGTLAMYQYGGPAWQSWNETLRELLIAEQVQSGPHSGSWNPDGRWGPYGGRIYSTALSTLCLEVYYRLPPRYSSGGRYQEAPE